MSMPRIIGFKKRFQEHVLYDAHGVELNPKPKVLLALPEFKEAIKKPGAIKYIDGMDVAELIGFCDKLFEMRIERRRQRWFDEIERLARHKAKQ